MARVLVNSVVTDAIRGGTGRVPDPGSWLAIEAGSVRALLAAMEQQYPGCAAPLANAAVAIDGDIFNDTMAEPLDESSELVFITAIEGG